MRASSQVSKDLKALARQAQAIVFEESAGESGRQVNWSYFVTDTLADYSLRELALECFRTMSEDDRRVFRARLDSIRRKR